MGHQVLTECPGCGHVLFDLNTETEWREKYIGDLEDRVAKALRESEEMFVRLGKLDREKKKLESQCRGAEEDAEKAWRTTGEAESKHHAASKLLKEAKAKLSISSLEHQQVSAEFQRVSELLSKEEATNRRVSAEVQCVSKLLVKSEEENRELKDLLQEWPPSALPQRNPKTCESPPETENPPSPRADCATSASTENLDMGRSLADELGDAWEEESICAQDYTDAILDRFSALTVPTARCVEGAQSEDILKAIRDTVFILRDCETKICEALRAWK